MTDSLPRFSLSSGLSSSLTTRITTGFAIGLIATALAPNALAQAPKLSPGLWELYPVTDGKSIAEKLGGKIPASVLKQMKNAGVQMTDSGHLRICVSSATADRGWQPQQMPQGCHYDVKWSGSQGKFITTCQGKTVSSGDIAVANDKAWSSTSRSKPEGAGRMVVQATDAKWVGADCKGLEAK